MDMSREEWEHYREFLLTEIEAWETGRKATPGQPMVGENYARSMVSNRARLENELRKIGAWGNPDYDKRHVRRSA